MIRTPNPFDTTIRKTERTGNQKLVEWMNKIIKEENLNFGQVEQETIGTDRKQPDIVIFKAPQSTQISLVLELKPPYFDPLDYEAVKKPAWDKANSRKAPYFATSNFKTLYLFNTEKANKFEEEEKQIVGKYSLSNLEDLNFIEEASYKNSISKNLTIFLKDLEGYIYGKKSEKLLPVDEWLILRLQEKVKVLSNYYRVLVEDKCLNDISFRRKLRSWFGSQGWEFTAQNQDFAKAARQTAYLLINKILFYDVLRASNPQNFPKLHIPEDFKKGGMSRRYLQNFFDEVLEIDYETIYSADFIDEIAFPDDQNVIYQIRELISGLNRFNFAEIEFEVLGRIFEGLIPATERHVLGQYFTHPDIVDLILNFAIQKETDKVFDPGCGAGTFLRRAYHLKKLMNPNIPHEEIIPTLWGNDIAKFPAHLATINLAIADLKSEENYPRIVQKDFFEWQPGRVELPETARKVFLKSLGKEEKETVIPRHFDSIVGNPPYTRQEEMDDLVGEKGEGYKNNLIDSAVLDEVGKPYAKLSRRAGLHAYFFVHGTKFLKNGGRFGFIVSNSWLDVDYGKGLQEHFLKHYKIMAIIESKVERWFEDADVNTCIVLLEKCEGNSGQKKKEREENIARFVYLKKPLARFIPKASRIFEETIERKSAVERLLSYIFSKTSFFENKDLRVFCKTQKELWEEGLDNESRKYTGAKWGKYVRAPKIFFTILEKAGSKLTPLKNIAEVKFGIKTGANEFFYLTEEEIRRLKIEKEFWMHKDKNGEWIPNYVIKSPRECKKLIVKPQNLKYRVLMIHKDRSKLKGTNVLRYIKDGERKSFHKRPTCASRGEKWYDLGVWRKPDFVWPDAYNDRYGVYETGEKWADKRFFFIEPFNKKNNFLIHSFLNSSLIPLLIEVEGITNLGEGAVYTNVYWLESLLVPQKIEVDKTKNRLQDILRKLSDRSVRSVFEEIGSTRPDEVSVRKVKPDRRKLDQIIMGDILGLTEEEQLEVYKAVIDLVKTRLDKAKSVEKKTKTKEGIDISLLVKTIVDRIGGNKLGKFYQRSIASRKNLKEIVLPELADSSQVDRTLIGFRLLNGKQPIDFKTEEEARFCRVFLEAGWQSVKMPKNESDLKKILPRLEKICQEVKEGINYYTEGVLDSKTRSTVERTVWQEVTKYE